MTERGVINYKGVDFEVEYDYQPEEAAVMYYPDGSGYPGCPEAAELSTISHMGVDFSEVFEDDFEEIELLILAEKAK